MRTTLSLDPDVAEKLKRELALGKRTFKQIVNDALRRGLSDGGSQAKPRKPFRVKPHSSAFFPGVDSGKLNQLADELEVSEFATRNR